MIIITIIIIIITLLSAEQCYRNAVFCHADC